MNTEKIIIVVLVILIIAFLIIAYKNYNLYQQRKIKRSNDITTVAEAMDAIKKGLNQNKSITINT